MYYLFEKTENKQKEAGVGPIFLKNEKLQIVPISATQSLKLQKYNLYLQIICQIAKWMHSRKSIVKGEMMHRNKRVLVYYQINLLKYFLLQLKYCWHFESQVK